MQASDRRPAICAFALFAPSAKMLPEPAVATGLANSLLLLAAPERRRRGRSGGAG